LAISSTMPWHTCVTALVLASICIGSSRSLSRKESAKNKNFPEEK
jgi:hypothetical protein